MNRNHLENQGNEPGHFTIDHAVVSLYRPIECHHKAMTASPYPSTDSAEVDGLAILLKKLNSKRVKSHINVRDKIPNHDGHLELVNDRGVPIGKLDVQLKARSVHEESIRIPAEAYDYSTTTTSPFIWIVVDLKNERCYWHVIRKTNKEYTNDKKSYEVKLEDKNLIEDDTSHIGDWLELARKYQDATEYISNISDQMGGLLSISGIPNEAVEFFQDYLLEFNAQLNGDYRIIRTHQLRGHREVGVAILGPSKRYVSYFICNCSGRLTLY